MVAATPLSTQIELVSSRRAEGGVFHLIDSLLAVDRPDQAEDLMVAAGARVWSRIDEAVRSYRFGYGRIESWREPRRLDVADHLELTLTAAHPDGFVRERAVTLLADLERPIALPMLVLRASDWVPQVRDRARAACWWYLAQDRPEWTAVLARMAFSMRGRRAGEWLAGLVEARLCDGPIDLLEAVLADPDRTARRAGYTIALDADRLDSPRQLHAARTEEDLVSRVRCAEAVLRSGRRTGDLTGAESLLDSPVPAIRAEALTSYAAVGELSPIPNALLDRARIVRSTAQVAVRRAGGDPASDYRELLAGAACPRPEILAGLGECGGSEDVPALRRWLAHPAPRGRLSAVRALRQLGDAPVDLLWPLLTDPSVKVAKEAANSLVSQAHRIAESDLRALCAPGRPAGLVAAGLRLLRGRDVWTQLAVLLGLLLPESSLEVRALAATPLASWMARSSVYYTRPSPALAAEITGLIDRSEPVIGADRARLLRFSAGLPRRSVEVTES
jgi:hypothetical protein